MANKREMSDDHKAALAEGRRQGRAVRDYLEALEQHKPKRGRKRTVESMQAQLAKIEDQLAEADPIKRLQLIQDRMDLQAELSANETKADLEGLDGDGLADRQLAGLVTELDEVA